MKLICKESCEQGLSGKLGGTFKLVRGVEYACNESGSDFVIIPADGKSRTVSRTIIDKMTKLGVIELA